MRIQFRSLAQSRTLPHALVARGKLMLWSAEGESKTRYRTPAALGQGYSRQVEATICSPSTGQLYDELRPGRPRTIEGEQIAGLLKRTLSRKPLVTRHGGNLPPRILTG